MPRYTGQIEWQLKKGVEIETFCPVCHWGNSNKTGEYPYCPYGHGLMKPIKDYKTVDSLLGDI